LREWNCDISLASNYYWIILYVVLDNAWFIVSSSH
jgi:hypothetical protein